MTPNTLQWFDLTTGEVVNAPRLPADLTNYRDTALALMDLGLVRCRGRFKFETTRSVEEVLALVRILARSPVPNANVYINNLRTGEAYQTTLVRLYAPPKTLPVRPALVRRHPFDYTLADVCDAATLREQHHAIYGAWIGRDLRRLALPGASKTLTFTHPQGAPHIRWATRHPALGHRAVYLITGWTEEQAHAACRLGEPLVWAPERLWRGLVLTEVPIRVLDLEDPDAVAELFGEFDLAEVNSMRVLLARAHGWNPLPVPRAWESADLPPHLRLML